MQLDPKAKLAARRAYQTEMSNRDMWHADGGPDDTPMDCAIRAYLEAASSPCPAPGMVEALREAAETLEWASRRMKGNCSGSDVNAVILAASRARKASLSQPAKDEQP